MPEFECEDPFIPPTEDEIEEMVNGPQGEPISQIIEELEREIGNLL